jgi:hypothetical protein
MPNYSKAYLTQLVDEFTNEFDTIVKAEVQRGLALKKSEDGDDDGGDSKGSEGGSSSGSPEGSTPPPPGSDGGGDNAGGPPAGPDAGGSAPADPSAAGAVPPADPAAGAAGGDPVQALVQAYGQLSPEELQAHFFAMKQILDAQQAQGAGAGAPGMDPAAAGAPPAPMGAGAPAGVPPGAGAPPPGPEAAAPMAGEASKPVDPALAMKSEAEAQLSLVKKEKELLEKSLSGLADVMEKLVARPERKSIQGRDLAKSDPEPTNVTMTKDQIMKKLTVVAQKSDLQKSDRSLINKYCVGGVEVNAIAHLLR